MIVYKWLLKLGIENPFWIIIGILQICASIQSFSKGQVRAGMIGVAYGVASFIISTMRQN